MSDSDVQNMAMALGRVPSGLFILTASDGERETGMLISWVQQCSLDPPQVTVAVRKGREVLAWLETGKTFTINLLADKQTKFIGHFGKGFSLDEDAFTGLNVERSPDAGPVLLDALAHMRCQVVNQVSGGDHELLIATVIGGRLHTPDGAPLVHVRKNGLRY
jgi:flavin reductase (DIM6/NTAB) family NADH-FMN oxidoreductase RutF